MWFVEKKAEIGRCRRHAPTMNGYPVVYRNDWCGDHKFDEEKVAAAELRSAALARLDECPCGTGAAPVRFVVGMDGDRVLAQERS